MAAVVPAPAVHVPMYEGTKHSTATDGIRRGVSPGQIQAPGSHPELAIEELVAAEEM